MKKICPHPPTPSPKIGRRGANFKVPLPSLGEGFRVRAKTMVLNLDEVYSLSADEVLHHNVAKVTHSGEGIQTSNTYYEVRLSNYEAHYASSC